jgi:hypothetical protein
LLFLFKFTWKHLFSKMSYCNVAVLHNLWWWKLRWESNSCLSPVFWCYNRLMMKLYTLNNMLSTCNYFLLLIFFLFLSLAFFQIIFMWQITTQFKWGYIAFLIMEKKYSVYFQKKNYDILLEKIFLFFFWIFF